MKFMRTFFNILEEEFDSENKTRMVRLHVRNCPAIDPVENRCPVQRVKLHGAVP